ncbi:hypothetical protein ACGFZS_45455 [Streptomyces sp. NPDC048288]|uniref:hypothetical protein n=1 Tax=Streptomyces sp. NPDC048288 TaxID=3365529 RepID=UPI003712B570
MSFRPHEHPLLPAALPGHVRLRYDALAVGVRRGGRLPAGAGRLARAGTRPGGSIEIEAAEFMAAVPGATTASIADLPADTSA